MQSHHIFTSFRDPRSRTELCYCQATGTGTGTGTGPGPGIGYWDWGLELGKEEWGMGKWENGKIGK